MSGHNRKNMEFELEQRESGGEWIPVTERIPEAYAQVLVSMYNIGWVTIGYIDSDLKWKVNEYITDLGIDVKAWRPLPDAYVPEV